MRARWWIVLLLVWALPGVAWAGTIRGLVTDEDGGPVFGAKIQVVGKARAVYSDEEGKYAIDGFTGPVTLKFTTEGYETQTQKVTVPPDGEVVVDAKLKFSVTYKGSDVVVTGRAAVDESPQTSAHTFNREEIQSNAGAMEDITKAVQQLPGIVSSTDFTSDMYVRGSESFENLIVLDHQLLANPYHFGVGMSIIDTDLVKNFTFYAAGFPAQYPFTTGSVLDITYKDGNKDHVDGLLELSALAAKAQATGPLGDKVTWIVSGRRSYYEYMLQLLEWNDVPVPIFSDVLVRGSWEPTEQHRLVAIAIRSEDGAKATLDENPTAFDEGQAQYNQITTVYGLDYAFLPTTWFLSRTTASYQGLDASGTVSSGANSFFGRAKVGGFYVNEEEQFDLGRNIFKFGGVYGRVGLDLEARFPLSQYVPGATFTSTQDYFTVEFADSKPKDLYGFYVQHEAEVIPKRLRTNVGLRVDHYTAKQAGWVVSPRASVATNLARDTVLKAAWGVYYLPPYNSLVSDEKLGSPNVRSEKSTHYVAGVEQGLGPDMMLRVESYYKEFDDLIYQDLNQTDFSEATNFVIEGEIPDINYTNSGYGRAMGLEVFFQKKLSGWWDGWLAYTLGEVRYNDGMGQFGWYYPSQDQRHTLSLVANFRPLTDWVFSSTFRLASGRPYTAVTDWEEMYPRTFLRYWQAQNDPLNDARFPLYHRLDVRVERTFHVHPRVNLTTFAECYNVYNQQNLWGYYYENESGLDKPKRTPIHQLPILPYAGIKATFL